MILSFPSTHRVSPKRLVLASHRLSPEDRYRHSDDHYSVERFRITTRRYLVHAVGKVGDHNTRVQDIAREPFRVRLFTRVPTREALSVPLVEGGTRSKFG